MFRVFLVHSEHSSTIRTRHLTAVSLQLVHGALSLLEGCFHGRFHIAMMSRGVERYHHMIDIPYLDPRKSLFGDAYPSYRSWKRQAIWGSGIQQPVHPASGKSRRLYALSLWASKIC